MGYFKAVVIQKLNKVLSNQGKIMAAIDDANAAIAQLQAEELQIVTDFQTLLDANAGNSEAAIEAVANQISAVTAALKAGDPVPTVAPPAS